MKIQGVELTEEHVGRRVTYAPDSGPIARCYQEPGTIKSWSEWFVFVRYDEGDRGIATRDHDLIWG